MRPDDRRRRGSREAHILVDEFLLGYGISLDLAHVPVCTFDREASQSSEALLQRFEASHYLAILDNVRTYPRLARAIDRGDGKLGLVIPPVFAERLADTGAAAVQAILDATDNNTANVAVPIAGMPDALQWLTYLNRLRYSLAVIGGTVLKGGGFDVLWLDLASMAALAAALLAFCILRFRKTLEWIGRLEARGGDLTRRRRTSILTGSSSRGAP